MSLLFVAVESDSTLAQRNSICHQVWWVGDCKRQVDWGTVVLVVTVGC